MNSYILSAQIFALKYHNTDLFVGTYSRNDNTTSGSIYKNNIKLFDTSGTFDIDIYSGKVYIANSTDIMCKNGQKITCKTDSMNISIHANELIAVSNSNGSVCLYNTNLQLQQEIKFCEGHTIRITKKYDDLVLAGCDCGKLYFYDLRIGLLKSEQKEFGIISIHKRDGKFLVGVDDYKLYVYDSNYEVENVHKLGNVYGIVDIDNKIGLACMYEGVKIVDEEFKVIDTFETNTIVVVIDYRNDKLAFSDLYLETYYEVEYGNKK